ncbi:MAG: hypothetical protein V1679_02195 [Candidatus Peregrinibacteria bacterium]
MFKKFLFVGGVVVVLLGMFLLNGCVDRMAIHNDLVDRLNGVLKGEADYFDEYFVLADGADTTKLKAAYEIFDEAFNELDSFFAVTEFAEDQAHFKTEFEDYYKPFMNEYLDYAGEFVGKATEAEYEEEGLKDYFEKLNVYTNQFVDLHNKLADTVNDGITE